MRRPPREEAWANLTEHVKTTGLISHALAVEAVMRHVARKKSADEELWGITGLEAPHKGDSAHVVPGLKQLQESRQPGRVRWPGGCSYKVAVDVGFGPIPGDILASRGLDFGATCRVRRAFLSFENACRGKNLCPVTNRRYRLVGGCKMTNRLENPLIQAQVFRRPPPGDDERIIGAWPDL